MVTPTSDTQNETYTDFNVTIKQASNYMSIETYDWSERMQVFKI